MLDDRGFHTKKYVDIVNEVNSEAKEKFGPDVNLSERTPLGIILRIFAWFLSYVYGVVQDVYYAAYIDTASGIQLDRLVTSANLTRFSARSAKVTCTVKGTLGATIAAGFRASTASEIVFETRRAYTIDQTDLDDDTGRKGFCYVEMYALEPGVAGNVSAELITNLVNPGNNVLSITNDEPATGGRNEETDQELRARFKLARASVGRATISAVRAALLNVDGVRAAIVIENDTMEVVDGNLPKSIHAYVLGGEDADITSAILESKAAGIATNGTESMQVADIAGNPHIIKFSRAEQVDLNMKVALTINNKFATSSLSAIKTTIVQYVGGVDADGSSYAGLSLGDKVIHSKIVSDIFDVEGVEDVIVQISSNGGTSYTQSNIVILQYQVAQISASDIEVTINA